MKILNKKLTRFSKKYYLSFGLGKNKTFIYKITVLQGKLKLILTPILGV
jgi:hypothetical protein